MVRVKKEITRSDISEKAIKKPESNRQKPEYKLYQKYLRSKQFAEVKEIVKERDGHKCMVCGREADGDKINLQIHHRVYTHLGCGGETEANDCLCVCNICHNAFSKAKGNLRRWTDKSPILDNWKP